MMRERCFGQRYSHFGDKIAELRPCEGGFMGIMKIAAFMRCASFIGRQQIAFMRRQFPRQTFAEAKRMNFERQKQRRLPVL